MAEDFNTRLSREDIRKFNKAVSELSAIEARREEIIKKVLDGEVEISDLRISELKKFFDVYSDRLDSIIAKKTSRLTDTFLILERQAAESLSAATSEIEKTKRKHSKKPDSAQNNGGGSGGSGGDDGSTGSSDNNKTPVVHVKVNQTMSDKDRNRLNELLAGVGKDFADQVADFFTKSPEERRAAIENAEDEIENTGKEPPIQKALIEERQKETELESLQKQANLKESILESMLDLEIAMAQSESLQNQATEHRLVKLQEAASAELEAQKLVNDINAQLAYSGGQTLSFGENGQAVNEAGEARAREVSAKDKLAQAKALEDSIVKYRAKKELEAKRKNNGILSKEDSTRIEKEIAERFKLEKLNDKKRIEAKAKLEAEQALKAEREEINKGVNALVGKGQSFYERKQAWQELTHDESGDRDNTKAISAALVAVSDLATKLETKIDDIASYKGAIDTRLQGSNNEKSGGSYWDQLVKDMTGVGAINPFFKQETFANNMKDLVNRGIAFDLKQRAFLMTIQDKIATTFDVADGTLLRLIRIQQEDSTAGRLGMESALNTFLNNMYETSEYLTQVADSVRGSLEEMQSLMQGAEAAEVEFEVQKWLGSLYSVGMSQNAVTGISTALGQIAAGQIEGLTNGGAGNLLVMAANDANLSIADILTDGLDASDTNKLLQAAVDYLAELSASANGNRVVQQQLADVFGVRASDLKAATNLASKGSTSIISGYSQTYDSMLAQLYGMAGSMGSRTSMAEMMTNMWENSQYSLAGSMASNPVSYFIYKMASVLDDTVGGIDLPFVNVMGFGVDLNTTVSDLMRVAAVGTGILGSLGPLVSSLGSSFSGQAMLSKLGIASGSGLAITPRGDLGNISTLGGSVGGGTQTTSGSGYVGNASGSDVKNSTIQESKDTKKQQMIEAKEEAEASQVDFLNTTVLKIYELLDDVAHGKSCFRVKVDEYGLTKASNGSSALGGVSGLGGNGGSGSLGGGSFGGSPSGSNSTSTSAVGSPYSNMNGSVSFSGWTRQGGE